MSECLCGNQHQPAVIHRADIEKMRKQCASWAVIPSFTVDHESNTQGIRSAFVHVSETNTSYYIDTQHRKIITWAGPLFIDEYDYENNPLNIRDNIVYDIARGLIIAFSAKGEYVLYPVEGFVIDDTLSTASPNPVQNKAISTALNTSYIDTIEIDGASSTDVLNLANGKRNILTGATTSEQIPFPVASSTQAGVMNSATFNAVQDNAENIGLLLNASVGVNSLPTNPTQDELTTAWETATGKTTLVNGAKINDITNAKVWTYYANISEWAPVSAESTVIVQQATNTSLGTVMGSEDEGQAFVEANGTLSVNGWDTVKSDIANAKSGVESVQLALTPLQEDMAAAKVDITTLQNDVGDISTALETITTGAGV